MLSVLSDYWRLLLSFLLALIIGWNLRVPVFRMAILKNFVDKPNKRSSHTGAVPNIGGVIVFVAFLVSFVLFACFKEVAELQYVLLGAILIFFVGIYDDFLQISPRKKLKGEMLGVIVLMVGGDFYFDNLHGFLGFDYISPWVGIPLTFIALVGLINAINLIDGIDGLSSGVVLMDTFFFGWWFYHIGDMEYALLCITLVASIIPFFVINLFGKRSKMFMGDSGALFAGFLLATLSITGVMKSAALTMFVPFFILSVPIIDITFSSLRRIAKGVSPFTPDAEHLHHKLLHRGFSQNQTVLILASIATISGAIASFLVGASLKFFMYAVLISVIMLVLSYLASKNKD